MTRNIYRNRYADTYSGLRFGLLRLIGHWRGNVFKLICTDILLFGVLFASLSILYRIVLMDYPVYRHTFEVVCVYAERFSDLIPMTLITGFYVTQVISRWWDQFMSLNWPDTFALKLVSYVPGAVSSIRWEDQLTLFTAGEPLKHVDFTRGQTARIVLCAYTVCTCAL
jgi:hypothetical protein